MANPVGVTDTLTVPLVMPLAGATFNHDPVAASYADRAVFLADGKIVDELNDPTSDSVFDRMRTLGA